jgi:hypothetical protein
MRPILGCAIFIGFLRLEFKSLDNVRMSSNNTPEKWASKFMDNAEMGNTIPLKNSNNTPLSKLNVYMPAQQPPLPPRTSMPVLGPMGTPSGFGMLPNLKKPLNMKPKLSAAAQEYMPPLVITPPAPAEPYVLPQPLIQHMLNGGRIYINDYPKELRDKIRTIMWHYSESYGIHFYFKNGKTGERITNPYYWISKRNDRPPLRSLGQTMRQRRNKRKQTRRRR